MLPFKRARFAEEDAAVQARETWNGDRFKPLSEYRQPKLALEQLREKYQRNYVLVFEQTSMANGSRLTTQTNNLGDWTERKGALVTIRACYVRILNPNPSLQNPSTLPVELHCSFDQDNIFQWNSSEQRWLQNSFVCMMPHVVSRPFAGGAVNNPTSAVYQAQSDDLNKVYIPTPFTSIQVELRAPFVPGNLASQTLEGQTQYAISYFKLVLDVQFIE